MKLAFSAHPDQGIHGEEHLRSNEVDWPASLPIPLIGDRLYLYGSEVEIVGRLFTFDPSRHVGGDDVQVELTWVDVRYGLDGTGRFPAT
ncbi:MAG TPA: hypothetical protein VMD91_06445 [Candidatus Sulfotelmatobacter sp.]|nr:hypothetical protein [Candidatus Sulfotelmatobacter sp.]